MNIVPDKALFQPSSTDIFLISSWKHLLCVLIRSTLEFYADSIGLDKSGYQVNIFLISPRKPMLWVLIRSASARRF